MKRFVTIILVVLIIGAVAAPALAFAAEKATTAPAAALISYPKPTPDVTAEEAKASTEWQKSGDLMNLAFALIGMGGMFGIVVWGALATRRAAAA